ncbi:MAG: hypothetical protein GTN36_00175 [Candidatus Aenigmarchaeota archaeon]|nr:hypothetical protein [Candidatus Aenigmarchaeota archaeon]
MVEEEYVHIDPSSTSTQPPIKPKKSHKKLIIAIIILVVIISILTYLFYQNFIITTSDANILSSNYQAGMNTEQKATFDSCVDRTYSSISSLKKISLDELKRQCYNQAGAAAEYMDYSIDIKSSCDKNMEESYNYYQSYTKEMAERDCLLDVAKQTKDPSLCEGLNNIEEKEYCKRVSTNISETREVKDNTYFDKLLNFSIKHPEGWNLSLVRMNTYTPEDIYTASLEIKGPVKNETTNCLLDTRPLNSSLTLKNYFDMMINQNYKNYEIISQGEKTIDGYKAYEGILKNADVSNVLQVIVIKDKTVFFIRCFASSSTFDKYKPDFNFIINSLNFE